MIEYVKTEHFVYLRNDDSANHRSGFGRLKIPAESAWTISRCIKRSNSVIKIHHIFHFDFLWTSNPGMLCRRCRVWPFCFKPSAIPSVQNCSMWCRNAFCNFETEQVLYICCHVDRVRGWWLKPIFCFPMLEQCAKAVVHSPAVPIVMKAKSRDSIILTQQRKKSANLKW